MYDLLFKILITCGNVYILVILNFIRYIVKILPFFFLFKMELERRLTGFRVLAVLAEDLGLVPLDLLIGRFLVA